MTHSERVGLALQHREADYVPVYPILSGVTRQLVGATYKEWSTDPDVCARAFLKSAEVYDIDALVTLIDLSVECAGWGARLIYPENEAVHPDYSQPVITDIADYGKIKYMDWQENPRMVMQLEVCRRLVKEKGGQLPIIAFVFGPLGVLSMLRNQQALYTDLCDDPEAVAAATREVARTLRDYAEALCDVGVDAIMWDTLFASGSIMSKAMWDSIEGEPMELLAEAVRQKGKLNMIHNCGQNIYFDAELRRIHPAAVSFLYPADDCADFFETKEKYGGDVTLIGCVTPATAVIGTPEEWDAECRASIDTMAKGGGFMLATGCEYPANASLAPAERMIELAKTYGRYQK